MAIYKDVHNVTYDGTAATNCLSVTVDDNTVPQTARIENGDLTHFVVSAGLSGTMTFDDPDEAAKVARKTADAKDTTFDIENQTGTAKRMTLTGFKSGGVRSNHLSGGLSTWSVPYVADAISGPAAIG
jgi:hypothetical protein